MADPKTMESVMALRGAVVLPVALRMVALLAAIDWLLAVTMVVAGVRRELFAPLLMCAAAALVATQAPRAAQVTASVRAAATGERWAAVEAALSREWSPRAARLLLREPRLIWSMILLVSRRRDGAPDRTFGACRDALPTWITLGVVAAVELAITSLLPLPRWLDSVLLIVGIWGLVVVVGLIAALVVHPHVLAPAQLRLRFGFWQEVIVPRAAIRSSRVQLGSADRGVRAVDGVGSICAAGTVNVYVELASPIWIDGRQVRSLRLWVDDPVEFCDVVSSPSP